MSEPEFYGEPGPGWVLRWYPIPNGAPDWSVLVPGDKEWRVVALKAIFATSVIAGDRVPGLVVTSQTRELLRIPGGVVVPASSSLHIQWAAGVGALTGGLVDGEVLAPMPPLPLTPGLTLAALTLNPGLGDTTTGVTMLVWEKFTGDTPPARPARPALVRPFDLPATVEA